MANRTMQAKARKLRAQRRRYPRKMDLDRKGPRPAKEVISEYRKRASTLGYDAANDWAGIPNTPAGKYDISSRTPEILHQFDVLHTVEYRNDTIMYVSLNFSMDKDQHVIIHQIHYLHGMERFSKPFPTTDDAYFALQHNCVPWQCERYRDQAAAGNFPSPASG